jgi:hypothetical protein
LEKIHQFNKEINPYSNFHIDKTENLKLLVNIMKNLRTSSIDIINYIMEIREFCSYDILGGKFNLDKINKSYKFDKNYLIKMKFDSDFLVNSRLSNFFEFEVNEADPFFCYFFFKDQNMEILHKMRISEDLISIVKVGQYLILQDLIYFNINSIYMKNFQNSKKSENIFSNKRSKGNFRSNLLNFKVGNKFHNSPKGNHERPATNPFNGVNICPSIFFSYLNFNF